jgi:hypothetical protein
MGLPKLHNSRLRSRADHGLSGSYWGQKSKSACGKLDRCLPGPANWASHRNQLTPHSDRINSAVKRARFFHRTRLVVEPIGSYQRKSFDTRGTTIGKAYKISTCGRQIWRPFDTALANFLIKLLCFRFRDGTALTNGWTHGQEKCGTIGAIPKKHDAKGGKDRSSVVSS